MAEKLRLVHLISSLKIGGAEKVVYSLVDHLRSFFDQQVIYFHDGPYADELKKLGIPIHHIKGTFARYDPSFIYRLIGTIKKSRPHLIHSSLWAANFFGVFAARLLKIPIVCSLHTVREHEGQIRNRLDFLSLPYAQKIIAVSSTIINSVSNSKLITPARLTLITNGIDTKDLVKKAESSAICRSDLALEPDHFVIGAVGRFVKVKKFDLLLVTLASLMYSHAHIRAVIVGIGPELDPLRALAKELSILSKVCFIIAEPAYNYLKLFDCFVQPSEYEGLSLALLEALSLQLPCIVTGKNKQHEIITHHKQGLIVEPNNEQELKDALAFLYQDYISNNLVGKRLGDNGSALVCSRYEIATMIAQYQKIFENTARSML
jgi:L-malate glycosyltransferase